MSMLAKIQAAKANLDADTARRPPKVQPQTAEFNQLQNGAGGIPSGGDAAATATRSRSFHFGSGSDSAATPAPPRALKVRVPMGGAGVAALSDPLPKWNDRLLVAVAAASPPAMPLFPEPFWCWLNSAVCGCTLGGRRAVSASRLALAAWILASMLILVSFS